MARRFAQLLDEESGLSDEQRTAINSGNAKRLFGRADGEAVVGLVQARTASGESVAAGDT